MVLRSACEERLERRKRTSDTSSNEAHDRRSIRMKIIKSIDEARNERMYDYAR